MDELNNPNETSPEIVDNIEEINSDEKNIFLPSGRALSIKETYEITAAEKSRFIILLGAVGSGKTAIITSIYNHFLQSSSSHNYLFAGSKTLFSFEENAFQTRTISNMISPEHNRTYQGVQDILHIRIKDISQNRFINMLFADFSGEDYENAIGNVDYVKTDFPIIESAISLAVLLDGDKLSRSKTKMAEIQNSIQLLRTFNDAGLIRYNIPIILVVSKYDLVLETNAKNWKELIISQFTQQFPMFKDRIVIQEVAPLSKNKDIICVGHGIPDLFNIFLVKDIPMKKTIDVPFTKSQFDIWGGRVLNEN